MRHPPAHTGNASVGARTLTGPWPAAKSFVRYTVEPVRLAELFCHGIDHTILLTDLASGASRFISLHDLSSVQAREGTHRDERENVSCPQS